MKRVVFAVLLVGMIAVAWLGVLLVIHANRPPITILSENIYPDLTTGGNILVVEYAIAGHAYAVTFRNSQETEYYRFKEHLSKVGRIE